jgi:hypothetical protein
VSRGQRRDVIAKLNPVLRGWGNYFRTGNASKQFNQLDGYVWQRLRTLRVKRKGRNLRPGEAERWSRDYFWSLGSSSTSRDDLLPRARLLQGGSVMPHVDSPPVSRVREIRTHGLKGGPALSSMMNFIR